MSSEKIALVTGAGSGIGRAVALALSGAGYAVVVTGLPQEQLEETAHIADEARTLVVPADDSGPAAAPTMLAPVVTTFERLDLPFNTTGFSAPAAPMGTSPTNYESPSWTRT